MASSLNEMTFQDLENKQLCGASSRRRRGLQMQPRRRCLWFQAQISVRYAKERWGHPEEEEVKDFYTPDFAMGAQAKVLDYFKRVI